MGLTATKMLIETIERKNFGLHIQVKIKEEFHWNESILKR
jgi:hypothetical protein